MTCTRLTCDSGNTNVPRAAQEKTLKLNVRPQDSLCRPLTAQRHTSDGSTLILKVGLAGETCHGGLSCAGLE